MKQILFFILLIAESAILKAQTNIFPLSGNVGIGTTNPDNVLTVRGINANNVFSLEQNNGNVMVSINTTNGIPYQNIYQSNGTNIGIHLNSDGNSFFNGGNVGIGTTTPTEKLSVSGKIRAKEIKVEGTNWPDYVFKKTYDLPSLLETERLIKQKGHLPGIPSAAEVKADGIDLGEMNSRLLQKIEELTLYMIEMKKENDQQRRDILYLKTQIK